jgi:hypothetical protein
MEKVFMDLDFLRQKDFSDDRTWKRAFDLALAVWRVSHFAETSRDTSSFADMSEEMLKRKLRKLASDIISELAPKKIFDDRPEEKSKLIFETVRKIENLRAHLRLVQNLKLTKEINCQVLDKEYRLLKEELLKETIEMAVKARETTELVPRSFNEVGVPASAAGLTVSAANGNSNSRLGKIVNYIKENKVVQLKEVLKFFPEYSEKTVRNDLKQLCGRNFIQRLGNGAGSCYKLVA